MLSTSKSWPLDGLSGLTKEPILYKNYDTFLNKISWKSDKDHEFKNKKLLDRYLKTNIYTSFTFIAVLVDNTNSLLFMIL